MSITAVVISFLLPLLLRNLLVDRLLDMREHHMKDLLSLLHPVTIVSLLVLVFRDDQGTSQIFRPSPVRRQRNA
jgi:hypothetical protein